MGFIDHLSPDAAARAATVTAAFASVGIAEADVQRAILAGLPEPSGGPAEYADFGRALSIAYRQGGAPFRPLSAIHAGANVPFGAYAVVDYLCASAPAIAAGFEQLARYFHLVRPVRAGLELRLEETRTSALVVMAEPPGGESWFSEEWIIGVTFGRFKQVSGPAFRPSRVSLLRPRPSDEGAVRAATDLLGCEIVFGAREAAIEFPPQVWRLPIRTSDPRMRETLERHAEELLAEAHAKAALTAKTREIIARDLAHGEPAIDGVAKKLAMTPRTLQRRLRDEGTTYKAVLEGVRADLAERYLSDKRVGITEVAFMLGYADASAFARAHKRWRGSSPAATRKSAPARG